MPTLPRDAAMRPLLERVYGTTLFHPPAISTTPPVAGQGPEKARHGGILMGITYGGRELKGVGPKFSAWYPIFWRSSLILGSALNLGWGRYC